MATTTQTANLFELACGEVKVTYSTSSFAGPPQLGYTGPEGERSYTGDEIGVDTSALGTEVTVTLEVVPDLHTITLTLLLPSFRLSGGEDAAFDTLAIKTRKRSTLAGPPAGADRGYEAVALHGVARSVDF